MDPECVLCSIQEWARCLFLLLCLPFSVSLLCASCVQLCVAAVVVALLAPEDDDGDFYSVTLAFRQTNGNKADGGQ